MIVSPLTPWALKPWYGLINYIVADKQKYKQTLSKIITYLNYRQKGGTEGKGLIGMTVWKEDTEKKPLCICGSDSIANT